MKVNLSVLEADLGKSTLAATYATIPIPKTPSRENADVLVNIVGASVESNMWGDSKMHA